MQITIELTEEEYIQVKSYVKRALMMAQIGMANLTITDKILGRLYMAAEKAKKTQLQRTAGQVLYHIDKKEKEQ